MYTNRKQQTIARLLFHGVRSLALFCAQKQVCFNIFRQ